MLPGSGDSKYCQICDIKRIGECCGYENCSVGSIMDHPDVLEGLKQEYPGFYKWVLSQPNRTVVISKTGYKCLTSSDIEEYKIIDEVRSRTTLPPITNSPLTQDDVRKFLKAVHEKN